MGRIIWILAAVLIGVSCFHSTAQAALKLWEAILGMEVISVIEGISYPGAAELDGQTDYVLAEKGTGWPWSDSGPTKGTLVLWSNPNPGAGLSPLIQMITPQTTCTTGYVQGWLGCGSFFTITLNPTSTEITVQGLAAANNGNVYITEPQLCHNNRDSGTYVADRCAANSVDLSTTSYTNGTWHPILLTWDFSNQSCTQNPSTTWDCIFVKAWEYDGATAHSLTVYDGLNQKTDLANGAGFNVGVSNATEVTLFAGKQPQSNPPLSSFHAGRLSEYWLKFGTVIDFSVSANRDKFVGPSGLQRDLGRNGQNPLSSSPDFYFGMEIPGRIWGCNYNSDPASPPTKPHPTRFQYTTPPNVPKSFGGIRSDTQDFMPWPRFLMFPDDLRDFLTGVLDCGD